MLFDPPQKIKLEKISPNCPCLFLTKERISCLHKQLQHFCKTSRHFSKTTGKTAKSLAWQSTKVTDRLLKCLKVLLRLCKQELNSTLYELLYALPLDISPLLIVNRFNNRLQHRTI